MASRRIKIPLYYILNSDKTKIRKKCVTTISSSEDKPNIIAIRLSYAEALKEKERLEKEIPFIGSCHIVLVSAWDRIVEQRKEQRKEERLAKQYGAKS